ncbi:MAG: ferritin family protein [Planctomycetota bacterium]|jgi:rubrerythrin
MFESRKEILEAAVKLERDGHKFWNDLAGKTGSEMVAGIFRSLAEDELKHIEWLEELASSGLDLGKANREIYGRLKGIFADAPKEVIDMAGTSKDDIDAFRLGLEMEERSEAAYRKWAGELDDPEAKALCVHIARAEAFHYQLIRNAMEYLDSTIDWFMQEERWLFDGG